jgi:hypothetical protein
MIDLNCLCLARWWKPPPIPPAGSDRDDDDHVRPRSPSFVLLFILIRSTPPRPDPSGRSFVPVEDDPADLPTSRKECSYPSSGKRAGPTTYHPSIPR